MKPENHADCATYVKDAMAKLGCDITVSDRPPIVESVYNPPGSGNGYITCPHGTTFYFEPTSEQIAEWVRDGVA